MRTALRCALILTLAASTAGQEPAPAPTAPAKVVVGIYLNDVRDIDLKAHSYSADLYVWFRWTDPDLPSPAATIEFVNPAELWGHSRIDSFEEPQVLPSGERYQVVRFQGRFSSKLPLYSYPFDRQTLAVTFEDGQREAAFLRYEADPKGVVVNPDLVLPGFKAGAPTLRIEDYAYPTDFGDPRHGKANIYSRATLELPIARPAGASIVKFLLPVLCVTLCAALMLMLRPSFVDARVGIGITALLTIVALQITTNDDLPNVDYLMLMDKIYVLAYVYVIAGLVVVVKTTSFSEAAGAEAGERLQRRSLLALTGLFVLVFTSMVARAIVVG
jgi:hypothetical protein